MISAVVIGLPLALLAAGIAFGAHFSTMNATISTAPRYLFAMGRGGTMPRIFGVTSKRFRTPYVALITFGALAMALIATDSLFYIASLSLFSDLLYYVIGIITALALRKRPSDLKRVYKALAIMIGAPLSAAAYVFMKAQLDKSAFVTGTAWCATVIVVYLLCRRIYGKAGEFTLDQEASGADDEPTPEERRLMDREYRFWKVIVFSILAVALFALPFVLY